MAIAETLAMSSLSIAMSSLSNSVLPDVLVEEILVRLPVKPIGRFRCVSKPWRTLLSSPKFIKSHNKLQILKPAGNLIAFSPGIEGYGDAYITTVNSGVAKKLQPEMIYLKVLGSCNGLLLLGNIRGFILINPITLENVHILDDRLGYDGHESVSFYYGFGYDSSSDDYKIVSLMQFVGYYGEPIVDIYSVRMKSWKRLGNSPYTLHYKNVCDCHAFANCGRDPVGVFLNGRIHWLGYNDVRYYEIVCFDLEREEFVEGLMPDSLRKEYGKGEEWLESGAKVLNGCLALVSFLDVYTMNLWVMREYGVQDSWTKLTTICCKDDEDPDHVNDVVCELNEDEIVLGNSNCGSGYKLFAYNWRNGISRNLVMDGLPPEGAFDAVPYQASLESPNFYVN